MLRRSALGQLGSARKRFLAPGQAWKGGTAQTDETIAGADSGNQYGDYNGLSGFLGKFFPSWTDRRDLTFEEIWTAPISDP